MQKIQFELFEKRLRQNSVQKNGEWGNVIADPSTGMRRDGKYVLYVVAQILDVFGRGVMTSRELINAILVKEKARRIFTLAPGTTNQGQPDSRIFSEEDGFEVFTGKKPFVAYEIILKVKDEEHHTKLVKALAQAKDDYCSDANWFLNPLVRAVGHDPDTIVDEVDF